MKRLVWNVAAITDRGLHRSENQDNYYISPDNRVFVVADGMGGLSGGARASQLAVEAVSLLYEHEPPPLNDKERIQQWLDYAVSEANLSVFNVASQDPTVQHMGTTIVVAFQTENGSMQIAHVGDSRAYMVRNGETIVLTQDHSVVMEMLLKGQLTPEQLKTSPFRHYLTRCVGHSGKVEIDNTPVEVLPGDWIIICTDGLSSVVADEEILEAIEDGAKPDDVCKTLLAKTIAGGAPDNVTIVAVHYKGAKKPKKRRMPQETVEEHRPVSR